MKNKIFRFMAAVLALCANLIAVIGSILTVFIPALAMRPDWLLALVCVLMIDFVLSSMLVCS